jgi:small subunit ribosomal protein S20
LAHSKSALKRWRQSIERRNRNRSIKSRTRTLLTKALGAISDDANAAEDAVREAISALDKAAQKGVIHANAAARGKSRLLKRLHLGQASAVAAAASAGATETPKRATRQPAAPKTPRTRTRKT